MSGTNTNCPWDKRDPSPGQIGTRPWDKPVFFFFLFNSTAKSPFCPVCPWDGWGLSLGQLSHKGGQKNVYVFSAKVQLLPLSQLDLDKLELGGCPPWLKLLSLPPKRKACVLKLSIFCFLFFFSPPKMGEAQSTRTAKFDPTSGSTSVPTSGSTKVPTRVPTRVPTNVRFPV